ncbi:MAG: Txe/YoeB family addiction module toxin [Spirochaetaceae bacterium]|nr:Txe/YoeB family addiction module toxin [Spirochaetaceae bacterium]
MKKLWTDRGWEDYLYWQIQNKNMIKKINQIIKDIERNPFKGIGKPEPLKNNLSGWWSRKIDNKHRIVYRIEKDNLEIAQCKDHYEG